MKLRSNNECILMANYLHKFICLHYKMVQFFLTIFLFAYITLKKVLQYFFKKNSQIISYLNHYLLTLIKRHTNSTEQKLLPSRFVSVFKLLKPSSNSLHSSPLKQPFLPNVNAASYGSSILSGHCCSRMHDMKFIR